MDPARSLEAEASFLALMLDHGCRAKARRIIRPELFATRPRQEAFAAAIAFPEDREMTAVDWADQLAAQRQGGDERWREARFEIASILEFSGAPENLEPYAALILDSWQRRSQSNAYHIAAEEALDETEDLVALANRIKTAAEIARERNRRSDLTFSEAMQSVARGEAWAGYVLTGFPGFDRVLHDGWGMGPGNLVTIAGRTRMGKTSLMLDIVRHACADAVPLGIITLEMSAHEIAKRLDRQGFIPAGVQPRIWYSEHATIAAISAVAHQWSAEALGLLVIDYVQLIRGGHGDSRYQQIGDIVLDLKALARQLDIPILVGAQLNREADKRTNHHPQLSDLRDSGNLEETSDVVALLYRESCYTGKNESDADLFVAKNRHGPDGRVQLSWDGSRMSFRGP